MSSSYTSVVVASAQNSARLEYICSWIFQERLGLPFRVLQASDTSVKESELVLQYGTSGPLSIPDSGLLWMDGIASESPEWGFWNQLPVCFSVSTNASLPFDLFAAVFYQISRMEEYGYKKADKHGRFDAKDSCLYQRNLLERPVVDEWVHAFGEWLRQAGLQVPEGSFRFLPTYDIDIAWSYRHKGFLRNVGGLTRDFIRRELGLVAKRLRVLTGSSKDPYDSFEFLDTLHRRFGLEPIYFLLAALKAGPYDKNIAPSNRSMRELISHLRDHYSIGLHPSYECADRPEILSQELQSLQQISGAAITQSRQHYIRFRLPATFQQLAQQGILHEYSMGYGAHLGFRAGTGASFLWYDLSKESVSAMRVHPFCFMDTTAHYEASLNVEEAFARLRSMWCLLEQTGSTLVTIFHNFSLGTDPEWRDWREAYELFIKDISV